MAKSKGNKRSRSQVEKGTNGTLAPWNASDHALRKAKQQQQQQLRKNFSDKVEERERRTALLTRDSKEKHEEGKLRLYGSVIWLLLLV